MKKLQIDLFAMGKLIFPINVNNNNSHWVVVAVFVQSLQLFYFDSYPDIDPKGINRRKHVNYVNRFLKKAAELTDNKEFQTKTFKYTESETPHQRNSWDCGVRVLMATEKVLNNEPFLNMTQAATTEYRKAIFHELQKYKVPITP